MHRRIGVRCRVVEEVPDHAHELVGVDVELRAGDLRRVDLERRVRAEATRFGEDDLVEVDGLAVGGVERRRVGDGDGQEVLDQSLEAHGVGQELAGRLLPLPSGARSSSSSSSARIPVSGLRSSWLASSTKRRCRSCESSSRASIAFIVCASRPISSWVAGSGTRRFRSSAPIRSTSRRIDSTGRKRPPGHDPGGHAEQQHQDREGDEEEAFEALEAVVHPVERAGDVHACSCGRR